MRPSLLFSAALAPLLPALACVPADEHEDEHTHPVTLAFEARVGDAAFDCAETYAGVGTTATTLTPQDLRFYVHDVRLVDDAGDEVPVTLDDTGLQGDGLALLDFENGAGSCADGTAGLATEIKGTVEPDASYTGLRFTLGVPFEQNHANPATAAPPLDDTTMLWNWQGGYKFLKLDVASTGLATGFFVHIGSTACDGDPATGGVTACANENRAAIALDDYDPTADKTIVDVAALLAGSDLDADGGGAPGCMSGPTDPECPAIFERLGLPFGAAPATAQSLFRTE